MPAGARKTLHLTAETPLAVEVRDGAIILRPVGASPDEDAFAYTERHRALVRQADADWTAGRVSTVSLTELASLVGVDLADLERDEPGAESRALGEAE